jgi:PKD repeat protein
MGRLARGCRISSAVRRLGTSLGALVGLGIGLVANVPAGVAASAPAYMCSTGPQKKLLDNSNVFAVLNGAKPPTFSTHGHAYCLVSITTYHWNKGQGQKPGTIGLTVVSGVGGAGGTVGPFKATGSSGQGGASNVNWTVSIPTGKVVALNGTYACSDSSPSTWSQNQASRGRGFCVVYGVPAVANPTGYKCTGSQVTLLNNWNVFGVQNGGAPPSFSTGGQPYCVRQLISYHWNNGLGKTPGTIGLGVVQGLGGAGKTLGPFKATSTSGQGGAPNVNWTASIPASGKPTVINGTYTCIDSDPASWSQNQQSGGRGFCQVYGVKAVPTFGAPSGKQPKPKPTKPKGNKPKPKPPAKPKCNKGKLGIAAAPDTGKPPLAVTFALCSPKALQWRIDYGDGQSKVATGSPPSSLTHTYRLEGDFRPTLTALTTPTTASRASTSVSVHVAQLISVTANPASGPPPLRVSFSLSTTAKSVTGWTLDYGDGSHASGAGNPPASLAHTYSSAGGYRVILTVKVGQNVLLATVAQVTVGGGTPPVLSLTATPTSGAPPLHVTFSTSVNIPGKIVSWELRFGDGQTAAGPGKPPTTVSHTYSRRGTYAAYLLVSQQQQYGGVLYVYPRGGLIIGVS